MVIPAYIKQFQCLGSECEDTCCAGWNVTLDKKTYENYTADKSSPLAKAFEENIERKDDSKAADNNFAVMKMHPETQNCNFLDGGLCSIHAQKGESFLANTCFNFPRLNYTFNNNNFQVLSLGCPEAARLALLGKTPFNFHEESLEIRESTLIDIKSIWGFTPNNMEEIRLFCLQLAQTEGIEIWQKLLVLGLFTENVNDLIKAKQQNHAFTIIQETTKHLNSGELLDSMKTVSASFGSQAKLFSSFWRASTFGFKKVGTHESPLQRKIIDLVQAGIFDGDDVSTEPEDIDKVVENYTLGVAQLHKTLEQCPDFEKNILLNELLINLYPFAGGNSPEENYLRLISRQCLLRFMMAGVCKAIGPETKPEELASTVQVFYRMFHHHDQLIDFFVNKVRELGLHQLNKLIILLKSN